MLEKPAIPDDQVIAVLQRGYGLAVAELTFLPLGADPGTAVYRVRSYGGTRYFLKLRKGFDEISVHVPLFLKSQGIREIIAPIETRSKQGWSNLREYAVILYPFVDGKDGFSAKLTADQRRRLGTALKGMHTLQVPPELKKRIPLETFSPHWRERLSQLLAVVERCTFDDPLAAELAGFIQDRQGQIREVLTRTQQLAARLASMPLEFVLCHTDVHGGNLLIGDRGELYIVDWDNPLLAPRERDLMFIGAGIDGLWGSMRQQAMFYQGYGKVTLNMAALAYYRYERVIEDLVVIGEQLLLTEEGGADRERSLDWFMSNFRSRGTLHIARVSDRVSRIRR